MGNPMEVHVNNEAELVRTGQLEGKSRKNWDRRVAECQDVLP